MSLENDILIERFLRRELSESENIEFLKKLEADVVFKEQFLVEKQLWESLNEEEWSFVNSIESKELKEYEALFKSEEVANLRKVIKEASVKQTKKKRNLITVVSGIAATIVLFFALNVFIGNSVNTDELYTEYIQLNEIPSFTNRASEGDSENLILAEELFRKGNYKKSLELFNTAIVGEKNNSSIYIYKAISYAELNDFEKANTLLSKLIKSNLIDAEKGYWYKSLVYIKSNKIARAKKELEYIIANSFFKKKEAKELLEKL